jgi:uncharacterized YccA/Bax inhibitor family protein
VAVRWRRRILRLVPNPLLSDKVLARETPDTQAGWAAPPQQPIPPAPDAVSPWVPARDYATMTVSGSVTATAVLLILLIGAAFFGWNAVEVNPLVVEFPGWLLVPMLGALVLGIVTAFRPHWARVTAPLYAVGMGVAVGGISHVYESQWNGIVMQAAGLTVGVLAVMLFLFATRMIRATEKFRVVVICATGAICLVYVFDLVLRLFGADMPFIHDAGAFGILFSLAVVVIASLNLILDFDFIEKGVAAGAPKHLEWYAAFGLLVTLVWVYLEMLRLLSKLRR